MKFNTLDTVALERDLPSHGRARETLGRWFKFTHPMGLKLSS